MTKDEFKNTQFTAGTMFIYEGKHYPVVGLHFKESLLGLDMFKDTSDLTWVRCESGTIHNT